MQTGAIFVVDDDKDDQEMVVEILKDLGIKNPVLFFSKGQEVLDHLSSIDDAPFIVLSDVNLPGMDGFQLRQKLLDAQSPKYRSVPFIFWSTAASDAQILNAYELSVHGFFIKEPSFERTKNIFSSIFNYWNSSRMPAKHNFS